MKTFEENGGWADANKLDEIEAVIGGELTRKQISPWFHKRRRKCGFLSRKNTMPSKRAKSVLSHVFAKNSGYVYDEELDELEETLDGELTRRQIIVWFQHRREKCGIRKNTKFSERAKSVLSHVFAKNSGYVCGEELDELVETLDGELTRRQIIVWFWRQRKKRGITSTK